MGGYLIYRMPRIIVLRNEMGQLCGQYSADSAGQSLFEKVSVFSILNLIATL